MLKRTLSVILLASILTSLVACGGEAQPEAPDDSSVESSDDTTASLYPELEAKNFEGKVFNLLYRSELDYEFAVDEANGDTVDDAVYKRNLAVEDKYNVELNFIGREGTWGKHMDFANILHSSVMAGDGEYDAVAGYQYVLATNITNGDLLNLRDIDYLELDAPWWSKEAVNALSYNGICYIAGGDIAYSFLEGIECMFFNKRLAEDYNAPDFYDLVRKGEWTHDKLSEVVKNQYIDLNNNGVKDGEDYFGLSSSEYNIRSYVVEYVTPTVSSEGELIWSNEHTINVAEKLVQLFNQTECYVAVGGESFNRFFKNNLCMLYNGKFQLAKSYREMEDDFGIIPRPKLDESQEIYYSTTNDSCSMMCVPITAPDPDYSGFILEALCRESTDTIAWAYYDVALQGKYARDEQSLEMIHLIRENITLDFGRCFSMSTGISPSCYVTFIRNGSADFASWYAENESTMQAKLDAFLDCFK